MNNESGRSAHSKYTASTKDESIGLGLGGIVASLTKRCPYQTLSVGQSP